jgi:hypothetical protein
MYKMISRLKEIHGTKNFPFLPKTYLLPNEYSYLEADMEKYKDKIWIAKPAASSQGRGIVVTNLLSEIPDKTGNQIVSEYINNPLLFDGYKFDLRVYVAITCVNPLRIYMFEEGLTRFATCKYKPITMNNKHATKYTHLTNYSINKNNAAFVKNKESDQDGVGSKWSHTALRKVMREQGIDDVAIWKKIEDIVVKTIIAGEPAMFNAFEASVPFSTNCFELLGFDILIDSVLEPWIIEVNLSPSLACDSPLDQRIKGKVVSDLFTLTGIVPLNQRKGVSDAPFHKKGNVIHKAYQESFTSSNFNQTNSNGRA